ncbi:MAG: HPr family phosphocarrier protein [Alphaproteobacteria bacterium]|nr:HPr family phosphocarrier protein [Alphaproteobacteria bacterium]
MNDDASEKNLDEGPSVRRRVTITNTRGLHARAAAKFAGTAGNFDADILVSRNEQTVSGQSIMGLMMLAAAPGCNIDLVATGPDAEAAIDALAALVTDKFQED